MADAFQVAATNNNLDVKAIAYTVEFQNTAPLDANLNSDGVTLNLSIDNAWVVANAPDGSVNNVKIIQLETTGQLKSSVRVSGRSGHYRDFKAISPHGLSTFGIVAVASSGTRGGGGGSNASGGGTGGGSTGGGGGESVWGWNVLVASQPGARSSQGQPIMAPAQNGPTTVQSLAVAGLSTITGSSGIQTFTLDTPWRRNTVFQ